MPAAMQVHAAARPRLQMEDAAIRAQQRFEVVDVAADTAPPGVRDEHDDGRVRSAEALERVLR